MIRKVDQKIAYFSQSKQMSQDPIQIKIVKSNTKNAPKR
jgi:hypothetical protein